jgi:hypothetical protein
MFAQFFFCIFLLNNAPMPGKRAVITINFKLHAKTGYTCLDPLSRVQIFWNVFSDNNLWKYRKQTMKKLDKFSKQVSNRENRVELEKKLLEKLEN